MLELYCARQGWTIEVIADLGSGMNCHKNGLKRLLDVIIDGQIGRLVINPVADYPQAPDRDITLNLKRHLRAKV